MREAPGLENTSKLQSSEAKMQEHKASMAVLGKEAASALASVESQQQRMTLQRIVSLVCLTHASTKRAIHSFSSNSFA